MSGSEVWVLVGTLTGLILVNWYFFGTKKAIHATVTGGVQEIVVKVKGGYDPAVIRAQRDVPIRLVFDRQETSSCSEEVVLSDFGIKKFLPAHEKTAIELQPTKPGTYEITCGMSMLHGKLVVE
jgi:plastocyanin domain-containing protein